MKMGFFEYYLLIVNIVGFLLFSVNVWLCSHTTKKQFDVVLAAISLFGGSAGILLAILLFDRKVEKSNVMSRVFIACIFIIQLVIFLILKGHISENITLDVWTFFQEHKILLVYLGIINLLTFVAFAVDKFCAVQHRFRIKIVTLLGLAFIGGSLGGLLGMYLFRHKIKKDYFAVGIPMMIVMQIVVVFYWMNAS